MLSTILLISKNSHFINTFSDTLLSVELETVFFHAGTKDEMLHRLETKQFDFIFIETENDHDWTTETIMILQTLSISIPTIVMSHHNDDKFKSTCMGNGVDRFIHLPISPPEISSAINHYL